MTRTPKTQWSPQEYSRFGDERSRPFFELLARVQAVDPRTVVDLGCASGVLTLELARRWPNASVLGLDSSAELLATAPADLPANVRLEQGDIADFRADGVDVVFTNAALQWLPQHRDLISAWAHQLNPGGWLALQVPGNFGAPSHALMRQVAESPRWAARLAGVLRGTDSTDGAEDYARLAISSGLVPTPGKLRMCTCSAAMTRYCGGCTVPVCGPSSRRSRPTNSRSSSPSTAHCYAGPTRAPAISRRLDSAGSSVWHRSPMGLDRLNRCQIPMPKSVH